MYETVATKREMFFPSDTKLVEGSKGDSVRRLQEWLTLHGFAVGIDGDFGPATARALQNFKAKNGLVADKVCDGVTWKTLVAPMAKALSCVTLASPTSPLRARVESVAHGHLEQHPREVGGQNSGPWVRAYMDGNQGAAWAWCAGFATFVLRQAASGMNSAPFIGDRTFSCDNLAASFAKRGKLLVQPAPAEIVGLVRMGDLFFVVDPKNKNDRKHVGIVVEVAKDGSWVETVEGNTNDDGSREGYEVCRRVRKVGALDFGIIG